MKIIKKNKHHLMVAFNEMVEFATPHLFILDSLYFEYNESTNSLREISRKEFKKRSEGITPEAGIFRGQVKNFFGITHPKILALLSKIEGIKPDPEKASRQKQHARNCGRVAKRLGISFINVLRMGYEDEEALKAFQASLITAKKKLAAMPMAKRKDLYHEIFECGRERRRAALESLGVKISNGEVRYMDFSELGK